MKLFFNASLSLLFCFLITSTQAFCASTKSQVPFNSNATKTTDIQPINYSNSANSKVNHNFVYKSTQQKFQQTSSVNEGSRSNTETDAIINAAAQSIFNTIKYDNY